jgi:carboxylate-amine ligase
VAPRGAGEPSIALLSEGPESGAFFEHDVIARRLGIPVVTEGDLGSSGGGLHAQSGGGKRTEIDVLYRRIDGERLTDTDRRPTPLGELLLEPLRTGTLSVANAFGSGVADDKLTHAYMEEAIRFYLGEEPLIASVASFDLGDPGRLAEALERLPELVVKPRGGLGGGGVLIGPVAAPAELEEARRRIEADPSLYVAQETVSISTHPSAVGDELLPRRVDLRPFAIAVGEEVRVPRAALTRFAPSEGELIVNSSRGGGAKDTWVLE